MKFPVPVLLAAALTLVVPAAASARPDDHGGGGRGGGGAIRQGGGWRGGGEGRGGGVPYGRGAPPAMPYGRSEPAVGNYGRYYRPAPMNVVPPPDSRYSRRYPGDDGGYYPEPPRRPANSLREGYHDQQDEAREGVRNGEMMSPGQIIPQLRQRYPGRILDAGIEEGPDGRTVYRIRWAAQNGRRMDIIVDARTGAVLGTEGQ